MAEFDLFVVGGQSNAVGQGDGTASPDPAQGAAIEYQADTNDIEDPLDDPIEGINDASDTGSAWPQFAVDYNTQSGNPVAIVGSARGGTAQVSDADTGNGNWDDTGTLSSTLITRVNDAITAIEGAGDTAIFRGVLWSQGETDAQAIDSSTITKAAYKTALEDMIGRYRAEFGSGMPFWIFQTGKPNSGDTAGYQDVRDAQTEVTNTDGFTYMASDIQVNFADDGRMSDDLHYTQTGYNDMGAEGADTITTTNTTMPTFQHKRGTIAQNDNYVGEPGELVVLTDDSYRVVVHDGSTVGGFPLAFESELGGGAAPSSVVQQFSASNFASPWPDDIGSNDMTVNGLTSATLSDGSDAVEGDGASDNGTANFPIEGSDLNAFAFEFTVQYGTDDGNTICGIINDGASGSRQIINVFKSGDGNISFDLRDSNETTFRFTASTNPGLDDGSRHDILFSVVDAANNDGRIWIDGSEVSVTVENAEGPTNWTTWDYDLAYYARNNQGTIDNNTAQSVGVWKWHNEAITSPTTT